MTDAHLRQFYDRWDRLEQDKAALQADLRELFAELKSAGFNPKVARAAFRHRAQAEDDPSGVAEFDSELELYLAALDSGGLRGASRAPAPARTREAASHDPETGEVTVVADGGQHFDAKAADYPPAEPTMPRGGEEGERGGRKRGNLSPADEMPPIPADLRRTRAA